MVNVIIPYLSRFCNSDMITVVSNYWLIYHCNKADISLSSKSKNIERSLNSCWEFFVIHLILTNKHTLSVLYTACIFCLVFSFVRKTPLNWEEFSWIISICCLMQLVVLLQQLLQQRLLILHLEDLHLLIFQHLWLLHQM